MIATDAITAQTTIVKAAQAAITDAPAMIMISTADKATTASTAVAQITDKVVAKADGDAEVTTARTMADQARAAHGAIQAAVAMAKAEMITTAIRRTTAIRDIAAIIQVHPASASPAARDAVDMEAIPVTVHQTTDKAAEAVEIQEWKAAVHQAIRAAQTTDKAVEITARQITEAVQDMVHQTTVLQITAPLPTDKAVEIMVVAERALAPAKEAMAHKAAMEAAQLHMDKEM